jgi:hypothetical protein
MLEAVSDPILYPSLSVSLAALQKHPQAVCRTLAGLGDLREFRLAVNDSVSGPAANTQAATASLATHQGFHVPTSLFETLAVACRGLRCLELHADNATVEDACLTRLVAAGIRLRRLLVHNCFSLTDASLQAMAAQLAAGQLTELELCWCGSLTDGGVAAVLGRAADRLERLTLNNNYRLTDAVLYALAGSLLSSSCDAVLTSLNLNFIRLGLCKRKIPTDP